jgi:hypothetical protein
MHSELDFFKGEVIDIIKNRAVELGYVVDMRKDFNFVRKIVNVISFKDPDVEPQEIPEDRPTKKVEGGTSIAISSYGFDLSEIH